MSLEIREAVDAAYHTPPSLAQIDAIELIARRAAQRNDVDGEVYALRYLYYAAFKMMSSDRMVAAYTALRTASRDAR